jgi:N-acetylglutamate synthase
VTIRELTMEDYGACIALWERTEGVGLSAADSPQNVTSFLARNPGMSFVAVEGGTIAGALMCGSDGRRGFLYHLAVAGEFRRRGIGAKLVERCLSRLRDLGMRKCHIFVMADNAEGQRFWKRTGWQLRTDLLVFSHDVPQ